jgi:hypothetical protein
MPQAFTGETLMEKMLRTMLALSGGVLLSANCPSFSADEKTITESAQGQSQTKSTEVKTDKESGAKSEKEANKEAEKKESKAAKLEKQSEASLQEAEKLQGEANQLKGLFAKPKK